MEEEIHKMVSTGDRTEKLKKAGLATAFKYYQENPPDIGYDDRYESYTFGVSISDKSIQDDYIGDVRIVDGDTIVFPTSSIVVKASDEKMNKFVETITSYSKQKLAGLVAQHGAKDTQCTGGILGLRFACIDTMEIPHFENIGSASSFEADCLNNGWTLDKLTFSEAWKRRPTYQVSKFWDYRMTGTAPDAFSTGRPISGIYNIPTTRNPSKPNEKPDEEPILNFVKIDNTYHQYYIMNNEVYILGVDDSSVVSTNNTDTIIPDNESYDVVADAGLAHKIAFEAVLNGSEMRIVVDGSSINQVGSESGYTGYLRLDNNSSSSSITKFIKYIYQQVLHPTSLINTGYAFAGLDVYNRALAVIYIKMPITNEKGEKESVWINLNKYLVANTNYTNIDSTMHSGPSQARNNFYSDLIKSGNYDLNKILYVDGEYAQSKQFDDRAIIQEKIWKNGGNWTLSQRASEVNKFNETDAKANTNDELDFLQRLNHWTMTIGDCTFFIPPECIRLETISQNQKMPIIRARGSMQKNATKVQEILMIDLYFNGEKGINGFEFETKVPKGDEITYHMNGLRALVAQFRVTPFLPIDNYYVNRVLCIDAVAMKAMSTQTVPGFPQLLKVSLQLQKFDYRIYMPEIPMEDDDVFLMRNYFSKQINYQIFRWYYQRLLINGDKLKDTAFLDDVFIRETFGNKTALVPMPLKSASIRFYIPNREHLNMMKQVKLSRLSRKAVPTDLNDNQKAVLQDFDGMFNAVNNIVNGDSGAYKELNNVLSQKTDTPIYIYANGQTYLEGIQCVKVSPSTDKKTYTFTTDNETQTYQTNIINAMKAAGNQIKTSLQALKNTNGNDTCTDVTISDIFIEDGESQTLSFESEMTERENNLVSSFTTVRACLTVSAKIHPSNISKDDLETLLTYATQQQSNENLKQYSIYSAEEILGKDGATINIPVVIVLKNVNDIKINDGAKFSGYNNHATAFISKIGTDEEADTANNSLDSTTNRIARAVSNLGIDVDFLAVMDTFAEANSVGGNELANKLKASSDYEDLNSIKWDLFDLGEEEIIAENFSLNEMNNFAPISLSSMNSYAPQFLGGSDVGIQFSFKTKSQLIAGALKSLPNIAAEYAREYRLVLSCWPVKIDSEITKFFGVTDVMIESVNVNTIPGYPGVFEVSVIASSVDRTLRNREAMERKQLSNFTKLTVEGKQAVRSYTHHEINDYLAERELYPDLQLPTIKEFNDAGFLFVRYSNQKRVYPDPDFYYTYSYMLYSQLIRESVLRGLNENTNKLQTIDSDGNLVNGDLYSDNWTAEAIDDERKKKLQKLGMLTLDGKIKLSNVKPVDSTTQNNNLNHENHRVKDYGYDKTDGSFGKIWNIANNIKICPAEKAFISDLVAYQRLKEKIKKTLKQSSEEEGVPKTAVEIPDEEAAAKINEISKADILKERHRLLTEQNEANDAASAATADTESSALNILGQASAAPTKTLVSNGNAIAKTKKEEKSSDKSKEQSADKDAQESFVDKKNEQSNDKNKDDSSSNDKQDSSNKGSKDNSETQSQTDTPAQSVSNTPSEKVDESDENAEPYNIKKWDENATKAIELIDEYLSYPITSSTNYNFTAKTLDDSFYKNNPTYAKIDYNSPPGYGTDGYKGGRSIFGTTISAYTRPIEALSGNSNTSTNTDIMNGYVDQATLNKCIESAAAAMNASEEYSQNTKAKDWKYYPYDVKGTIINSGQKQDVSLANRYLDALDNYEKVKKSVLESQYNTSLTGSDGSTLSLYTAAQGVHKSNDTKEDDGETNNNITGTSSSGQDYNKQVAEGIGLESLGGNDEDTKKKLYARQLWVITSDLANYGIEFGAVRQRMHTASEINLLFDSPDEITDASVKQYDTSLYLIDPFYRNEIGKMTLKQLDALFPRESDEKQSTYGADYEDDDTDEVKLEKARQRAIRVYKAKCVIDEQFAKEAFWRICLVWLRKLIKSYIFPSFCYDIFRGSAVVEDIINSVTNKLINKRANASTQEYADDLVKRAKEINKLINEKDKAKSSGKYTDAQITAMEENITKKQQDRNTLMKQYEDAVQTVKTKEMAEMAVTSSEASSIQEMFNDNAKYVDKGKVFLMTLLAAMDTVEGTPEILKLLINRDIDNLNAKTRNILLGSGTKQNLPPCDEMMRKYVKALVGYEVIDADQLCKGDTISVGEKIVRRVNYNNYVAAANDPTKWLVHSFHDMVVHDARGRMARAFPTFFMCFIDEGRTTRRYKLHDNFYNTSSIADITITKSRKIPADTAEITLSNFYQTFTTDDEDLNYNYTVNLSDVISNIFGINDAEYAEKLENRRTNSANPERFHIRPGARIHIRMGYGGDASSLPILFNGIVTEVSADEVVNVVAQGDGQELAKPILMDKKASDIVHAENVMGYNPTNGVTPKIFLDSVLTSYGSYSNKIVHEEISEGGVIETIWDGFGTKINPFGIYHFGDRDYQYVDGEKEPTQNIFEIYCPNTQDANQALVRKKGVSSKAWDMTYNPDDDLFKNNGTVPDYPLMEFEVFNKSIWECAHILNGLQSNYFTSITPFDFRSSLFFGCAHDYCAYTYEWQEDETWLEKRKPFQQYHIVTSITDIISNQVTATPENISTCMVGVYKSEGSFNNKFNEQTDPVWVDKSIYPEMQKTAYFDTNLYGAPSRKLWWLSDLFNWCFAGLTNRDDGGLDTACDTSGEMRSHKLTAEILTRNALKENIWDMYQGPLTIIGDPTIKPYDRISITDFFQEVHGDVQVRDVVYNLSPSTGFTTVVYPDLIATTADCAKDEVRVQTAMGAIKALGTGMFLSVAAITTMSVFRAVAAAVGKNTEKVAAVLENLESTAAKSDKKALKAISNKVGSVLKFVKNETKGIYNMVKTAAGVAIGTGTVATAGAAIATTLIPIVAMEIVGTMIANKVDSKMRNRRALTLFPIKHYNRVMVAGINGHTGLCYGSPSWSAGDMLENTLARFGNEHPVWATFFSTFVLGGTDPFTMASNNKRMRLEGMMTQERIPHVVMSEVIDGYGELALKTKVNPTVKRFKINSTNMRFIMKSYGVFDHAVNASGQFQPSKLKDVSAWTNMVQVSKAPSLQKYLDMRYFRVANEQPGFDEEAGDKIETIEVPLPTNLNAVLSVKAMKVPTKNDKEIYSYDIPFLHPDAIAVLSSIIDNAYMLQYGTEQERDEYKNKQDTGTSAIVLKSALRIGESADISGTGYRFELEATDEKSSTALQKAVEETANEFIEENAHNPRVQKEIFKYKTKTTDSNTALSTIVVMPADAGSDIKTAAEKKEEKAQLSSFKGYAQ